MTTRKPLPYLTYDDLACGHEVRIKRHKMDWLLGVVEELEQLDKSLWLTVRSEFGLHTICARDISWDNGFPMIQRTNKKGTLA